MKIEKAKEIQAIMNNVEINAKALLNSQVKAGAAILHAVTTDEEGQVDIGPALWALVTYGGELSLAIEELGKAVEPFLS